jgi:hypothetical protein
MYDLGCTKYDLKETMMGFSQIVHRNSYFVHKIFT